jgi:hypothetical protein
MISFLMVDEHIQSESRYGNTFSIISLSIKDTRECEDHRIGHVTVNLGKILDACAEQGCMYDGDRVVMLISWVSHSYCS